jgi:serine protease AprX
MNIPAQQRFWVFFRDKEGVEFDPYSYFDPAVIKKRLHKDIPLVQFSDLPLRQDYVSRIEIISGKKSLQSRWLNAIAIEASENQMDIIKREHFVSEIKEIVARSHPLDIMIDSPIKANHQKILDLQLNTLGVKYFEENNIDGRGIRIAVFDGGFPGVDKSPLFEHLRNENRIIACYDFVKKDSFVYAYNSHGTSVLTCIAGKSGKKKFGLATGAEFLLARTEVRREVFSEEENWLAAMEWADKNGADIISSSLGYTYDRYFPHQMDGKFSLVTRAANMAASKGILVINAAGNDGDKDWEVIGTPADADSVLSIGGISTVTGIHIDFSSFGPTYDGRLKPNVCALGEVTTSNGSRVKISFGTSFATPLVSGFAACVLQMHPEWDNMKTFDEIQKSGHLYPYFDYAHGYGVPQASYFTGDQREQEPTFTFVQENDSLKIILINLKDKSEIPKNTENEYYGNNNRSCRDEYDLDMDFLYFKVIIEPNKKISRYGVVNMSRAGFFSLPLNKTDNKGTISVYFKGYVDNYKF